MANKKAPSTMTPLGLKVARGPAAAEAVKVTDNTQGWAEVANIPVPPAADKRDFSKPLGQNPLLVNGGKFEYNAVAELGESHVGPGEGNLPQGLSFNYDEPVIAKSTPNKTPMQLIEINWYGARLELECLNAIFQKPNVAKGLDGWLMLELSISTKTKTPAWVPPIAQLTQDGKIHVPEFECTLHDVTLKCQILNIDITDAANKKRVFIFRVTDFTDNTEKFN